MQDNPAVGRGSLTAPGSKSAPVGLRPTLRLQVLEECRRMCGDLPDATIVRRARWRISVS